MPFDFERLKKLAQQAKLAKQRASAEEAAKQEEHKRALRAACIKNARERAGQIIRGIPAMLESAAKDAQRSTFIKLVRYSLSTSFSFEVPLRGRNGTTQLTELSSSTAMAKDYIQSLGPLMSA